MEFHTYSKVITADGSHTLRQDALGVPFHSIHGAITESKHVFINAGLTYQAERRNGSLVVLEVGYGTGLNALLTCQWAKEHRTAVTYHGIDPVLLPYSAIIDLGHAQQLAIAEGMMAVETFHAKGLKQFSTDYCDLHLVLKRLESVDTLPAADVVYYDAFAPKTQPEMWDIPNLEKMYKLTARGGVLVTYCAQGQFKRNLRACGFTVESLPGPPGKREMVRAHREGDMC